MIDIEKIRADFPILSETVYGNPLIYFDNAATTQKPQCVIDKIVEIYRKKNANVHRGVHFLSQEATEEQENARQTIQKFINASSSEEIIFTKGTTESINLVASSFCRRFCNKKDEILITAMEHHSNIVPWHIQRDIRVINLKIAPINDRGELIIEEFEKLITDRTRLISVTHISNVLGTINPLKAIVEIAHRHNIPVMVDAAQSAPHIKIDVQDLDCDFLAFSGHKIYGPTGIGVLYGKQQWLEQLPPYQGGGEMINSVSFEKTTLNKLPYKFEAGTPNYVGAIATSVALDYINDIGLGNIATYEHQLLNYATEKLKEIDGLTIYGEATDKSSVISFTVDGTHPYDMGTLLDRMGVAVRTGHHCAEPLLKLMGTESVLRASFAFYNTKDEIDRFIGALKKSINLLKK